MTKKIFVALGGVGYARTDIRINDKREAYFLEINPNPGIFYGTTLEKPELLGSGDFVLLQDKTMNHVKFIELIMEIALKRAKNRVKKFAVRYRANQGYACYATMDIKAGEIIERHEEKATYITSKSHVQREWTDPLRRSWFDKYAYPLTDEMYVLWSENPNDWSPLNHSCDPNGWLCGMDLVARREIKKGEQITMDYSTFCADNMETFECQCRASDCRRTITGTDYLQPFVEQKYNGHISDFVETKRKQLKISQNSNTIS